MMETESPGENPIEAEENLPPPPEEDVTNEDDNFPAPPPENQDIDIPPPDYDQDDDQSNKDGNGQSDVNLKDLPPPFIQCPDLAKVEEPGVKFEEVSLSDARKKAWILSDVAVSDPQPNIEGSSLAMQYQVDFDTNFGDRDAYITGNARFLEEATIHADLISMLEEGQGFIVMLYTWRSCSGAYLNANQSQGEKEELKQDLRQTFIAIMEPLVSKLTNFMQFTKKAVDRFGDEVKKLCRKENQKDFVSEAYLLTLGKLINMFAEMNNLLNTKSSITNDYACYRRTKQAAHMQLDVQQIQESQNLSMFLATQNSVMELLKESLKATPNYEDLLFEIVALCMKMYEQGLFFDPLEKYSLIKAMAVCLFLIDREGCIVYKAAAKKKIDLSKIDKIFKVVLLYGDVQIYPYTYMQLSHNFDATKWVACESSQPSPQADIVSKLASIRVEHRSYICHLAQLRTAAEFRQRNGKLTTDVENKELYTAALQGLQLTSSWTQQVLEVYCWKILHPVSKQENPKCKDSATDYEKSIRYNYSSREKFAMVEIIAMIKGLQRIMVNLESIFQEAITRHIYAEIQKFIHVPLTNAANHALKKKKQFLKIILMAVIDICQDNGKKSSAKSVEDSDIPRKCIGPTSTQLYMTRTMLESVLTTKSHRKDLGQQWLPAFDKFHKDSFHWSYMLNFSSTLQKCCDLSQLWYREFFLEMTKGERIQFPTEMSFPWILTDHILESKNPAMIEYVLYPLDLYNDSAQYALNNFHTQHLYDEIEAEVNLVFDQFVFKVSNQIFAYYKHRAGCMMMTKLDKLLRSSGKGKKSIPKPPPASRYETLLQQRHVQILGRSVDMNRQITQKMTAALSEAVEIALCRFEANDLTNIMELEGLLQCNRLAHRLLSKYLALKDFDDILKEANDEVHNHVGRIARHVENEVINDFVPNYCYNSTTDRFVKSQIPNIFDEKEMLERGKIPDCSPEFVWGTKDLNKYNQAMYSPYRGFVGPLHFETIARLIGYGGVIFVIRRLLKSSVEENLKTFLPQIVKMLIGAMPEDSRLPLFVYGAAGIMAKYQAELVNIMQYADLKLDVLHGFTIIGNAVLFCLFIERGLMSEDIAGLKHSCLFQNRIPRVFIGSKEIQDKKKRQEEVNKRMAKLEKEYSKFHVLPVVSKHGNPQQVRVSELGYHLTRDRLCLRQPMFIKILEEIKTYLDDEVWRGTLTDQDQRLNFGTSKGFHHLWSAIQFFYCIPVSESEMSTDALHGEGLYWAGCVIILLLGQQERFEALDFCYYLRKIFLHNIVDDTIKGIEVRKMMTLIRNHKFLNDQIFAMLNNYLSEPKEKAKKTEFKTFEPPSPPTHDADRVSVC